MINRWLLELRRASIGDSRFWDFQELLQFEEESRGERPCGRKLRRTPIGKKSETPPAESVLRIPPVYKEPPAARARKLRDQDNTRRCKPDWGTVLEPGVIETLYPPSRKQEHSRLGLQHQERSASTLSTTGRGIGRERCEEALVL